ncbi:hypothetical protein [Ornithinimicrobium kibberense]|uniref:hypothetical protein n=1 Tax=Ornithinimicrobium kibberense TaxID=282060 RepID=UPI0036238DDA
MPPRAAAAETRAGTRQIESPAGPRRLDRGHMRMCRDRDRGQARRPAPARPA